MHFVSYKLKTQPHPPLATPQPSPHLVPSLSPSLSQWLETPMFNVYFKISCPFPNAIGYNGLKANLVKQSTK